MDGFLSGAGSQSIRISQAAAALATERAALKADLQTVAAALIQDARLAIREEIAAALGQLDGWTVRLNKPAVDDVEFKVSG